mmetsp:Transcript_147909/g.457366  ORF Transcript_147909/g.457366 Transcript_147909/m.457366 type:complete len:84 (-) Transcript_147909:239-490(-)
MSRNLVLRSIPALSRSLEIPCAAAALGVKKAEATLLRGSSIPSSQEAPQWIRLPFHISTSPAAAGSALTCAHGTSLSGCMWSL